jgi:hypothetical protein
MRIVSIRLSKTYKRGPKFSTPSTNNPPMATTANINVVPIGPNVKLIRNFQTGEFVISSENGLILHRDFKMLGFILEKTGKSKIRLDVIIDNEKRFDCEIVMTFKISTEKIMDLYETLEDLVFLNKIKID